MKRRSVDLLAVLALAAAALGVSGPSHASPASCSSNCTVKADTNTGYVSPVIELTNGASVSWLPSTTSHPTTESNAAGPCFQVAVGPGVTPVPVRFASSAFGVTATIGTVTRPCDSAKALGDKAWAVTYHCQLHFWMNGTVVVDR